MKYSKPIATRELILIMLLLSALASIKAEASQAAASATAKTYSVLIGANFEASEVEEEAYLEHADIEREQRNDNEEESIRDFCEDEQNEKAVICQMQGE